MTVINGRKNAYDRSKLFDLKLILLPREMLLYEPEVLLNGWKFKVRINLQRLSVI